MQIDASLWSQSTAEVADRLHQALEQVKVQGRNNEIRDYAINTHTDCTQFYSFCYITLEAFISSEHPVVLWRVTGDCLCREQRWTSG